MACDTHKLAASHYELSAYNSQIVFVFLPTFGVPYMKLQRDISSMAPLSQTLEYKHKTEGVHSGQPLDTEHLEGPSLGSFSDTLTPKPGTNLARMGKLAAGIEHRNDSLEKPTP